VSKRNNTLAPHRLGAGEDEGFYEANSAFERIVHTRRLSSRLCREPVNLRVSFGLSAILKAKLQSERKIDTHSDPAR